MALAIRLSRGGRKARPFYRIVVTDKRMPRDGRYIEKLGTYNPLLANDDENRVVFNEERVKYWLGEGAKPSERVAKFLGTAGIIEMPAQPNRPQKSAPSEKTLERQREKEERLAAAAEAAKEAEAQAEQEAQAEAEAPKEEAAEETADAAEAPAEDAAPEAPAEEEAKAEEAPAEETPAEEAKEEAPAEEAAEEEKKD